MRNANQESREKKRKPLKIEIKETLIMALLAGFGLFMFFKGLSLLGNYGGYTPAGIVLVIAGSLSLIALGACHFLFDYAKQMGLRKGIIAYVLVLVISVTSSFFMLRIISR